MVAARNGRRRPFPLEAGKPLELNRSQIDYGNNILKITENPASITREVLPIKGMKEIK